MGGGGAASPDPGPLVVYGSFRKDYMSLSNERNLITPRLHKSNSIINIKLVLWNVWLLGSRNMQNGVISSLKFYCEKKNELISTIYTANYILFDKAI